MQLPFSTEQFFGVFRQYNETVWPAQIILLMLALGAVALVIFPRRWSGVAISAILAFLWAWLGLAYHLAFFASVNPLAYVFSAVSVGGAIVFIWQGVARRRLEFGMGRGARTLVGFVLVLFAVAVYPAWSIYAGHRYPALPTFGLPCPTTIFTLGILAFLAPPYPRSPFLVPVLWCFVGAQAAFLLGVSQDLGLIVAGITGIALVAWSRPPASRSGGAS
jgi:hypothetical protein